MAWRFRSKKSYTPRKKIKKYSAAQKYAYHDKRINSDNATDKQKAYSFYWTLGFRSDNAQHEYTITKADIEDMKRAGDFKGIEASRNLGYLRGLKANLDKKK